MGRRRAGELPVAIAVIVAWGFEPRRAGRSGGSLRSGSRGSQPAARRSLANRGAAPRREPFACLERAVDWLHGGMGRDRRSDSARDLVSGAREASDSGARVRVGRGRAARARYGPFDRLEHGPHRGTHGVDSRRRLATRSPRRRSLRRIAPPARSGAAAGARFAARSGRERRERIEIDDGLYGLHCSAGGGQGGGQRFRHTREPLARPGLPPPDEASSRDDRLQ